MKKSQNMLVGVPQHKMIARFWWQVPTLQPFWSQGHRAPVCECVQVSGNRVIVSKIFFHLIVNIAGSSDNFCFILLWIEMAMYQCIIFHDALCHHASCYIINIYPIVATYSVRKGGEIFKLTTWIRSFIDKHLNFCSLYYNC